MIRRSSALRFLAVIAAAPFFFASPSRGNSLGFGEQIDVQTFESMREVERHQLGVAQKFYLKGEHAIALDEYDKFLTLYETSPGAPYAMLMWSHCQRRLRKVNTAIREGFQSVIDYWPESREAALAEFFLAECHREIGEVEKAGAAYHKFIARHPDDPIAVRAKVALLDLARVAQDAARVRAMLEELTFRTERTEASALHCREASVALAAMRLRDAGYDHAAEALAASFSDDEITDHIHGPACDAIRSLRDSERAEDADKLAARMLAELERTIPEALGSDAARASAKHALYRIASVHSAAGNSRAVMDAYERAGKLLGLDDEILGRIAEWKRSQGERDAARDIYARFTDTVAGLRHLAGMDREDSRWEDAADTYERLIALDPERAGEYRWAIAECWEAAGRYRDAISAYRRADSFPTGPFRMAACHRQLDEFDEALSLYRQIKAAGPEAPEADLQIAFTHEQAGMRDAAIDAFQLTCKAHPTSPQASRAHARLQDGYGISITLGGAKEE